MAKLTMTKGLPASGKTTWAKEQVAANPQNVKRINKDDLRSMFHGETWSRKLEKDILLARDVLVDAFLAAGKDVVVDDTNFAPVHEETLRRLAEEIGAEFEIKDFSDVPLSICLRRDNERANYVGEKVIKSMYNTYLKKKPDVAQYSPIPFDPDLPSCLIVDIDGTLAHMNGRSPYDYTKVDTDIVDERVRDVVWRYSKRDIVEEMPDTYIVIVSGREDSCKATTEQWLKDNAVPYDEIHMRKQGDLREDSIIKREIYEEYIKNRYNVRFVLDDRNRVVKMWRELGLVVLQVAEGDF